jgi:RNA polymerase sigma factor for flagellar operon FliA
MVSVVSVDPDAPAFIEVTMQPSNSADSAANNVTGSAVDNEIIRQYIGYANSIAREWVSKIPVTIDPADIYSAALDGLHSAASQFDPEHGAAFTSYARAFIIGRIKSQLRKLDTLTRGERQVANDIAIATTSLQQMLSRLPSNKEIAMHLGIDPERVREVKSAVDERTPESIDEATFTAVSDLYIPEESALAAEQGQYVRVAVASLPETMRVVVEMIYFESIPVNEVAQILGITHEAVSQRHMKGRELLQHALTEFVGHGGEPEVGRVGTRQRQSYLDSFQAAVSNPSAMLRSVEFAA